jgi:hypothetical protein
LVAELHREKSVGLIVGAKGLAMLELAKLEERILKPQRREDAENGVEWWSDVDGGNCRNLGSFFGTARR